MPKLRDMRERDYLKTLNRFIGGRKRGHILPLDPLRYSLLDARYDQQLFLLVMQDVAGRG